AVAVVGVRHDGVQAVVAAGELDDDEHGFLRPRLAGRASGQCGAAQEQRSSLPPSDDPGAGEGRLHEFAAAWHGVSPKWMMIELSRRRQTTDFTDGTDSLFSY